MRSPYITEQNVTLTQPVPFSHQHHVGGLGLDCRYCHTSVETARFAGIPPTFTCMTCHSQLYTNAAVLASVRQSLADHIPIHWHRVNRYGARLAKIRLQSAPVHTQPSSRFRDIPAAQIVDALNMLPAHILPTLDFPAEQSSRRRARVGPLQRRRRPQVLQDNRPHPSALTADAMFP